MPSWMSFPPRQRFNKRAPGYHGGSMVLLDGFVSARGAASPIRSLAFELIRHRHRLSCSTGRSVDSLRRAVIRGNMLRRLWRSFVLRLLAVQQARYRRHGSRQDRRWWVSFAGGGSV